MYGKGLVALLKIFIGYDEAESIAWHSLSQSIIETTKQPVSIIPLSLSSLEGIYDRKLDPRQSNAFSFTRFLTPYLSDYQGLSVYMDCDMMLRTDINEICSVIDADPGKAVYVVKHDYSPKSKIKYLGNQQYSYPRKNWSSVVLWNCSHPANQVVTPNFVNDSPPSVLHRFQWLKDEEIGDLDVRWNWLVGEYENTPCDVKNVHWTLGGPYFREFGDVEFADEWESMRTKMNYCRQLDDE